MKKTFKVVMLPTEKASETLKNLIHKIEKENKLILVEENNNELTIPQHLYIISDEEIKEGDWFYHIKHNYIFKKEKGINGVRSVNWLKIVATTDKSLIIKYNDEVLQYMNNPSLVERTIPQLPESFIQAYIKAYNEAKPITEVDLEMTTIPNPNWTGNGDSTILGYTIKTRPDNTVIVHQSKMYTRDEVIKLIEKFDDSIPYNTDIDKWIQENLS